MDQTILQKYAHLLVKKGINLQKNQTLVIGTPIECADFARMIAEAAYQEGAREVVMNWHDEKSTKLKLLHANDEIFDEFPEWRKEFNLSYARKGAAFLNIAASDPDLMSGVDTSKIIRQQKVANKVIKEYIDRLMSNKNVWCVASIPTVGWAKKVFPDVSDEEAVEKLWDAIFKVLRVDQEDPIQVWNEHNEALKTRMNFLNQSNFKKLRFKNSLGTDLEVELPTGHIWLGGSEETPEKIEFIANMPTEEIFSLPKKTGINGTVFSSKPLNYSGTLIDEFSLTFKDGRIVDFTAKKGYDALKNIIETDEGSHYIGEVALVPYESPISQSNILFYNTLFDENASCHLAIGRAYPSSIKNGDTMTDEELEAHGVNNSVMHVDFMFGTKDLELVGMTTDNKEITIMKNGNFTF